MNKRATLFIALALLSAPIAAAAQSTAPSTASSAPPAAGVRGVSPAIENGSTVSLEFTISDEAGTPLATNKGHEPLTFKQGEQQVVPGLERELLGMQAGDVKKVTLKPEDAFGPVDPRAETEVPKSALPPDALTVGTKLMARTSSGQGRPVVVKEIKDETVVLDLNHPLAGKTLVFDVKVLGVEPPGAAQKDGPSPAPPSAPAAPATPAPGGARPKP